jgi:hypothetical protein
MCLCGSEDQQRLFPYTELTGWVCNRDRMCLLRVTNWTFKYNSNYYQCLKGKANINFNKFGIKFCATKCRVKELWLSERVENVLGFRWVAVGGGYSKEDKEIKTEGCPPYFVKREEWHRAIFFTQRTENLTAFITSFSCLSCLSDKSLQYCEFLSAFAKLRKATISFVMSVRLSAWENSAPIGRIFMKFDIWGFFENMSRKFKHHQNRTRINGTLH